MSFEYDAKTPIFKHFNLHIRGGDKLHLIGANGSGKTTLIKLICGKLSPTSGSIRTIEHIAYLDQSLSILSPNKTIVENIASIANIQIHDAHAVAANFGFRGAQSKKLVKNISGGELLKATLAAVIGSKNQPDLLILDEPTNNLDIKSTTVLENALREYGGALLLVSHDNIFIKNIGIENKVLI
ncbi:MAG: ATP-binding cassette domain-containing protein [Alphaproteobacteria bacterium]|nr:ATP-binding cassette domain-containing protein [Alphaproteobacteria bacterium]